MHDPARAQGLCLERVAPRRFARSCQESPPPVPTRPAWAARSSAAIVHTYSPAYSPRHFAEVVRDSDHIIFNSLAEYQRHRPAVEASERPIAVRPAHQPGALRGGRPPSTTRAAPVRDWASPSRVLGETLPEGISGLHFHTLCELGSDALQRTLEAVERPVSATSCHSFAG